MIDPYVYKNGTLRNKFNIEDYHKLNQLEADLGFIKLIDIDSTYKGKTDTQLIKDIHKHIFEDIFDWAGEYRTVPVVKEEFVLPMYSIPYSDVQDIDKDLKRQIEDLNNTKWDLNDIDELSMTFARKLALLWRVHPFRDGNTRTTLSFAFIFAKEHNFPFNISTLVPLLNRYIEEEKVKRISIRDMFVLACLDDKDYPEVEHLANLFKIAILNYDEELDQNKKM